MIFFEKIETQLFIITVVEENPFLEIIFLFEKVANMTN